MNGKKVKAAQVEGGRFVVDDVASGQHTLEWRCKENTACGLSFGKRLRRILPRWLTFLGAVLLIALA